ncbi:HlyD family secretion protein [Rhodoblastus acidophilus]|uniref:HlyD family secretion protein n=1 Tax=Candidatus Rhodoblastus alkanivorans TaxID=2954117 RepID=A0ABS9Z5H8_9HYPH|nr:HlyD family secretion protein [Candidatus Rhodoblastus alkanivorans]MCI4678397.1 HlyD family secretion protein [Candidatus Rhodoblastus alkanivorans]MCI4682930.1 HlyD family secretion protein [Candidatus Rhodoblastus alkanivorans]MDI4640240.1 HlyD family secretion protein [Rhodoblastus acidophilus]
MKRKFRRLLGIALTLCAAAGGLLLATALWRHYMIAPWTRDARVRVETVTVAPEVAGNVRKLLVSDNQPVKKGDILFVIDPRSYQIAVAQAEAALDGQEQSTRLAQLKSQRRAKLTDLAISKEEKEQYEVGAKVADAAVDQARAQLDMAKLNLERSIVRSPVNGYVTNLRLREGDFVAAGQSSLTIVDRDSFWLAGYFEETQLASIHPGEEARYVLMGYPDHVLTGRVASVSRGVADQDAGGAGTGLASVNPVFTWVRLAQRVPVRIVLDPVPSDVTPVAGLTATVEIGRPNTFRDDLAWAWAFWRRGWRY